MSGRDRLGRVYAHLGPAELARLVIAAVARGDEREVDRLAAATPVSTWTGPVAAYEEVLDAAQRALRVGLVAGAVSARLVAVDALLEVLALVVGRQRDAAAVEVCRLASACGLDDQGVDEALTALHGAQERAVTGVCHAAAQGRVELAGAAASAWAVFDRYASEHVGVEPAVLARALLPPDFRHRTSIESVEPDWAAVDEVLALLDEPGETEMTGRGG